ncbi:hypothetical protein [Rhodopila sp.]|uniref:hypothetical protein n=1 Tax=Rhodopila sp. TaxID=2480087 RepID=UPI003D0DF488
MWRQNQRSGNNSNNSQVGSLTVINMVSLHSGAATTDDGHQKAQNGGEPIAAPDRQVFTRLFGCNYNMAALDATIVAAHSENIPVLNGDKTRFFRRTTVWFQKDSGARFFVTLYGNEHVSYAINSAVTVVYSSYNQNPDGVLACGILDKASGHWTFVPFGGTLQKWRYLRMSERIGFTLAAIAIGLCAFLMIHFSYYPDFGLGLHGFPGLFFAAFMLAMAVNFPVTVREGNVKRAMEALARA